MWGLGRHYIGSNFFWYLRDPAGNFAEYYADLDVIADDEPWSPPTSPTPGPLGMGAAGPPVVHRARRPRADHGIRLVVSGTTVILTGTGSRLPDPATRRGGRLVGCGPIACSSTPAGQHPPPGRGGGAAAVPDRGVGHPPPLRPPHRPGRRRVDPVAERCAGRAHRRAGRAEHSFAEPLDLWEDDIAIRMAHTGRTDRPCYEVLAFEAAADPSRLVRGRGPVSAVAVHHEPVMPAVAYRIDAPTAPSSSAATRGSARRSRTRPRAPRSSCTRCASWTSILPADRRAPTSAPSPTTTPTPWTWARWPSAPRSKPSSSPT